MALYAFDGTGNEDETNDTNVLEFFRGHQDPHTNDDTGELVGSLYLKGIGTRAKTALRRIDDAGAIAQGVAPAVTASGPPARWPRDLSSSTCRSPAPS